ncbi:hypothetical protein KKI24_07195 [bacterium]|nr:hypothetical protein [bacterium]
MISRKVKIFEWKRVEGEAHYEKVKSGVGLFHQWGMDYEEFESGPGNYSTAIVEMEDGTVQNVHCSMVQFIL